MRKKPNLDLRMEKCADLMIKNPEEMKGSWKSRFHGYRELHLEIGCGKGRFTVETAKQMPDVMLIAVEREPSAMVMAMERVQLAEINNVVFISADAAKLSEMFAEGEMDRIYINFCDPWPKSRDAKLRLTAPAFLRSYADILAEGGEIHFKTDNTPLFDWSINIFNEEGWVLRETTHDLHCNGPVGVMTDYESKFYAEGLKINRTVAVKTGDTKNSAAGQPERLRNAALSDARNC